MSETQGNVSLLLWKYHLLANCELKNFHVQNISIYTVLHSITLIILLII